jgi:hypothetical protein
MSVDGGRKRQYRRQTGTATAGPNLAVVEGLARRVAARQAWRSGTTSTIRSSFARLGHPVRSGPTWPTAASGRIVRPDPHVAAVMTGDNARGSNAERGRGRGD